MEEPGGRLQFRVQEFRTQLSEVRLQLEVGLTGGRMKALRGPGVQMEDFMGWHPWH